MVKVVLVKVMQVKVVRRLMWRVVLIEMMETVMIAEMMVMDCNNAQERGRDKFDKPTAPFSNGCGGLMIVSDAFY